MTLFFAVQPIVVITCVNYSDFLQVTLPTVTDVFDQVVISTSPEDTGTHRLCRDSKAALFITDAWRRNGDIFNKAAAITECLLATTADSDDQWVLLLDADIVWPKNVRLDLSALNIFYMYSAPRRICEFEEEWRNYCSGTKCWDEFSIDVPSVRNGKIWGMCPTTNPAGLMGYFQLWHIAGRGGREMPPSRNAAVYDVSLGLSYPEERRKYLPFEVLHLGPVKQNWNGRVSPAWHAEP